MAALRAAKVSDNTCFLDVGANIGTGRDGLLEVIYICFGFFAPVDGWGKKGSSDVSSYLHRGSGWCIYACIGVVAYR